MYSTLNKGKSAITEIFIRTLKNKIYKHIDFSIKKCVINKLDDIVNKCNNTYHSTIKLNPVEVKSSTYIDFDKRNNKEDPKFRDADHVRISKYKNIFTKDYVPKNFL